MRWASPDRRWRSGSAQGWRRHAEFGRALATAERMLAADPGRPRRGRAASGRARRAARAGRGLGAAGGDGEGSSRARTRAASAPVDAARAQQRLDGPHALHHAGAARRRARAGDRDPARLRVAGGRRRGDARRRPAPPAPAGDAPEAALDEQLRGYLEGVAQVVERVRPAVLHPGSDYRNALVALELGRRYELPVVYEVRGFPEMARARWASSRAAHEKALWRRTVEAECWRSADRVVTLAEVMRDRIVAHGVDPERIVVIPNAVDAERFRPVAPDPGAAGAARAAGGGAGARPRDEPVHASKGSRRCWRRQPGSTSQGRRVRVLLVGEGLERAHLRQLARRLGIADRVVLAGRVPHEDVAAYLRADGRLRRAAP